MSTDLRKTLTISLSDNRKIKLLFVRPTVTANWICQTTDETLTDMQELLDSENIQPCDDHT